MPFLNLFMPKGIPNNSYFNSILSKRVDCKDKVYLVGIRGYYLNDMGKPGVNDRGIYDDAIGLVSPEGLFTFNANCDPAIYRKGIANLVAGQYKYKLGIHGLSKPKSQQYMALVQASPVTVLRDGEGKETGYFGINIHRGARLTVSSIGCQTIVPDQWEAFYSLVKLAMSKAGQKTITYNLVDNV